MVAALRLDLPDNWNTPDGCEPPEPGPPVLLEKRRLPLLTSSSAKTFRRCAKEYQYRYELERVPASRSVDATDFGTLIHHGLEAWFLALRDLAPLAAVHSEPPEPSADVEQSASEHVLMCAWEAIAHHTKDPLDQLRAEELMLGYHLRWFLDTRARYEVLGVEVTFEAPLLNPDTDAPSRTFARAGKLDVILRERATQRIILGEHKTSSEQIGAGATYWQQLTLDSQISTYLEGAKALGITPDACLYDVLGKPKLEPYEATPVELRKYTKPTAKNPESRLYANQRETDETLEEFRQRLRAHIAEDMTRYFQRGEIVRLEDEVQDAKFDDWRTAKWIRESQLAGRWPRNVDACKRFGRLCAYHSVCTRLQQIDDPLFFRHAPAHGELQVTQSAT